MPAEGLWIIFTNEPTVDAIIRACLLHDKVGDGSASILQTFGCRRLIR